MQCPKCKGDLVVENNIARCTVCGAKFRVKQNTSENSDRSATIKAQHNDSKECNTNAEQNDVNFCQQTEQNIQQQNQNVVNNELQAKEETVSSETQPKEETENSETQPTDETENSESQTTEKVEDSEPQTTENSTVTKDFQWKTVDSFLQSHGVQYPAEDDDTLVNEPSGNESVNSDSNDLFADDSAPIGQNIQQVKQIAQDEPVLNDHSSIVVEKNLEDKNSQLSSGNDEIVLLKGKVELLTNEVEDLRVEYQNLQQRMQALENGTLKKSKQANSSEFIGGFKNLVKNNIIPIIAIALAVVMIVVIITPCIMCLGVRGMYVNVDNPQEFISFLPVKYTRGYLDVGMLTSEYVIESGKYSTKKDEITFKQTLTKEDKEFIKEFGGSNSDFYDTFSYEKVDNNKIIVDGKTFIRVSKKQYKNIVGKSITINVADQKVTLKAGEKLEVAEPRGCMNWNTEPDGSGIYYHYGDKQWVSAKFYEVGNHKYQESYTCSDRACSLCGYLQKATTEHNLNAVKCVCEDCNAVVHSFENDYLCLDKTCYKCGYMLLASSEHEFSQNCSCINCGFVYHDFKISNGRGVCSRCNIENTLFNVEGNVVYFGSYPQSKVTNSIVLEALGEYDSSWSDYGLGLSTVNKSYMYYIDKVFEGEKYRGIYFAKYRKADLSENIEIDPLQLENGYECGKTYWFKYEPIKWQVLQNDNGEALIIADMVLDSQEFNYFGKVNLVNIGDETIYPNNYQYSSIREWLNTRFYQTAFDELQKSAISTYEVEFSDGMVVNDYISLIDFQVYKENFEQSSYVDKFGTDYAKSQGLFVERQSYSDWWYLNSTNKDKYVPVSSNDDVHYEYRDVGLTCYGVVPVLKLKLCTNHSFDEYATCIDRVCRICGLTVKATTEHSLNSSCRCTSCGQYVHNYENGVCTVCGDELLYFRDGDSIYFGKYPQTQVTDKSILNVLGGYNEKTWRNYNYYYSDSNSEGYMYYYDAEYNGEKYRGVYFTSYRPRLISQASTSANSYQSTNGFSVNNVYWFKYEPIKWTIVSEQDGYAIIVADMLLDSQEFFTRADSYSETPQSSSVYCNNYEYSTIRTWLNKNFINTAFTSMQKKLIEKINVDNSLSSTGDDTNKYICNSTEDYIWLLSYSEASSYFVSASQRQKQGTDYAKCQGLQLSTMTNTSGNSAWYLRTPNSAYAYSVKTISYSGGFGTVNTNYTNYGILPALKIKL